MALQLKIVGTLLLIVLVSYSRAQAQFNPAFPLEGFNPLSALIINSVFDLILTSGPYHEDGKVQAYSGEGGSRTFGDMDGCYQNSMGSDFVLGGNYRGAVGRRFLCYDGHPGVDFKADGVNVLALDSGTIIDLKNDAPDIPDLNCNCFGNFVKIRHSDGFISIYGHLKKGSVVKVKGESVGRSEVIAISGNSGVSSGPHLHLELRRETARGIVLVDPYSFWDVRYYFSIDNFKVVKNGSLLFEDTFSDGVPPPSAPNFVTGSPASYFVAGTFGPEGGGKLTIDSSGADVAGSIPPGDTFLRHRARLATNIDPTDLTRGLKIDDTFSVTAVFDLIVPAGINESYGISLHDRAATRGNDDLRFLVRRSNGMVTIDFARADFIAGTFTVLDSISLDPTHQQIALTLSRPNTSNNAIVASFAYVDGGVQGPTTTLVTTANIFQGENFTRARFMAETQLP